MIVAMQQHASAEQIQKVIERLTDLGFEVHRSTGAAQTVLGAVGAQVDFDVRDIEVLEGVQEAHRGRVKTARFGGTARKWPGTGPGRCARC